jgi:cytochrome c553
MRLPSVSLPGSKYRADNPLDARAGLSRPLSASVCRPDSHAEHFVRKVAAGVTLLLCSLSSSAQDVAVPAFKSFDSIEARVQGCVTCHGQSGQGTNNGYFPRIAGKPAGYLYNQLVAFRDATRKYAPMNYLVAYLPDPYLHEIAEHFAKQRPAFAAKDSVAVDASTFARGKLIATVGDSAKQIPACIACHGAGLTGMQPGIPGLVGLHPTYIVAQLTRWRVGDRHAADPDCMKRIATRLSETDVAAVAAWLGSRDAPKDASPESSNLVRMPLACGSQK